jgi:transglutaminase-like putative cysteine protease
MKTALVPDRLERATIPWLLACAVATVAPHTEHLPLWLSTVVGVALLLRSWLWLKNRPLPARWLLVLVVVATTAGVYGEYRTLFGRDAGVALLTLFMALKPMEMSRRRDAVVVVMLGFFLLLTHYFYSQGIPTGLWLIGAVTLQIATLIRIYGGAQPPVLIARHAAQLLLQAVPFMLVLFLLFPRVSGPLWGLPQDAHGNRSGLPETISPGSISELILNGAIAFRARFSGTPPANTALYWRGPVMDEFDGRTWKPAFLGRQAPPQIEARGASVAYELTLEPHNQRWLLALDAPIDLPPNATLSTRMQVLAREPVRLRSRFFLRASIDYRAGQTEAQTVLATALQLPGKGNQRARTLAAAWRQKHSNPQAIAAEAQQLFRQENFVYTLNPPLLGDESIDQFLFETKSGFCEHYASAFTFLMRAAGIPARVVAGYQGGEFNPIDGYVVVRQSDAHAWAEIWIDGRGWTRVDPTAAIAPSRVEQGIAAALPEGETLPVMARIDLDWLRQLRFRLEAINNSWNQWVLGYNPDRQRELLSRFGLGNIDWRGMTALLSALCGLALLGITAWTLWQRPRTDAAQRIWLRFCAQLAKCGAPRRESWEGPLAYAQRVAGVRPEYGDIAHRAAMLYADSRYGNGGTACMQALKDEIRRLPTRWSFV